MRHRLGRILAVIMLFMLCTFSACTSVSIVRIDKHLPTDVLSAYTTDECSTDNGPVARIETRCIGFYFATVGFPECNTHRVTNELLQDAARRLGAYRLVAVRQAATPDDGLWWLTKLLGYRRARATAFAIMNSPDMKLKGACPTPPPRRK